MKRRAFKLVVFLLLGAIVNVAVAWGTLFGALAQRPSLQYVGLQSVAFSDSDLVLWRRYAAKGWPSTPLAIGREDVFLYGQTYLDGTQFGSVDYAVGSEETALAGLGAFMVRKIRLGIPARALSWEHWIAAPQRTDIFPRGADSNGFALFGIEGPRTIIWPGFAINTVFYAGILWGLFAAPFALRRRRRIKRGLCPACAYPIGDSELCTECGAVVTPRVTSR